MRTGGAVSEWKVIPIAPGADVFLSPDPAGVSLGNPSIVSLPGGRIVVSFDMTGPGTKHLEGAKAREPVSGHWLQGKVLVSSDKGKTWTSKVDFPFHQAQLFRVGHTIYLMGLAGTFRIMRSVDGGESWSKPAELAMEGDDYVLTPVNVFHANENVYLVVMKRIAGKNGPVLIPVVFRAREGTDLANRKAWTVSEPCKSFAEFVPAQCFEYFGIQSSPDSISESLKQSQKNSLRRSDFQLDWATPHLVEIIDPNHRWRDPRGRTLHLFAETHTNVRNVAAIASVISDESGGMTIQNKAAPSDMQKYLVSMPGGHMKFDIAYDETSHMYWLACNPCFDTMIRSNGSYAARSVEQQDDRRQLLLFYSPNLVDWCLAACIDSGSSAKDWRHFCSLSIGGNDLFAVCCSGYARPGTRGYSDRITFHSITAFRELIYSR